MNELQADFDTIKSHVGRHIIEINILITRRQNVAILRIGSSVVVILRVSQNDLHLHCRSFTVRFNKKWMSQRLISGNLTLETKPDHYLVIYSCSEQLIRAKLKVKFIHRFVSLFNKFTVAIITLDLTFICRVWIGQVGHPIGWRPSKSVCSGRCTMFNKSCAAMDNGYRGWLIQYSQKCEFRTSSISPGARNDK